MRHRKIIWNGVEYDSIKACAEAIGKSRAFVKKHHNDPDFYWRHIDFTREHTVEEIAKHMYLSGMLPQKPRRDRIYRILKSAIDKIFEGETDLQVWLEKNSK